MGKPALYAKSKPLTIEELDLDRPGEGSVRGNQLELVRRTP